MKRKQLRFFKPSVPPQSFRVKKALARPAREDIVIYLLKNNAGLKSRAWSLLKGWSFVSIGLLPAVAVAFLFALWAGGDKLLMVRQFVPFRGQSASD